MYILDFEGNLYGKEIYVDFISRIRDTITFASIEELQT